MERRSSLTRSAEPGAAVLAAFDVVDGDRETLIGGGELSVRVGDVVLKQVDDIATATWTQVALSDLDPNGWRVPTPRRTVDGRWSVDGWIATDYIAGLRSFVEDPARVVRLGQEIGRTLRGHVEGALTPVRRRVDRWAVADRVAWAEQDPDELGMESSVLELLERLSVHHVRRSEPVTLVHGDLANNVFVDPAGVLVVLDFAPYVRPQRYGDAIVVVDHLLWFSTSMSVPDLVDDDAVARALAFRLVADRLGAEASDDRGLVEIHQAVDRLGL